MQPWLASYRSKLPAARLLNVVDVVGEFLEFQVGASVTPSGYFACNS